MSITMFIISMIGLAIVQIQMFRVLPKWLRFSMANFPLFGIILNFAFSQFLLHFIGLAYGIGLANMLSSVLFAFYINWYRSHHGLNLVRGKFGMPKFETKDVSWTN